MAVKKIVLRPEGTNDYGDELYPRTSADMVVETATQKVFTDLERAKLAGIGSGANVTSVAGKTGIVSLTPPDVGVDIATKAEAEAGVNNAKYMTPLRVKEAVLAASTVTPSKAGSLYSIATTPSWLSGRIAYSTDPVAGASINLSPTTYNGSIGTYAGAWDASETHHRPCVVKVTTNTPMINFSTTIECAYLYFPKEAVVHELQIQLRDSSGALLASAGRSYDVTDYSYTESGGSTRSFTLTPSSIAPPGTYYISAFFTAWGAANWIKHKRFDMTTASSTPTNGILLDGFYLGSSSTSAPTSVTSYSYTKSSTSALSLIHKVGATPAVEAWSAVYYAPMVAKKGYKSLSFNGYTKPNPSDVVAFSVMTGSTIDSLTEFAANVSPGTLVDISSVPADHYIAVKVDVTKTLSASTSGATTGVSGLMFYYYT